MLFKHPGLFTRKAHELPLSGQALLELIQVVLARGAAFRFCARGWSMAPFIRDGDVITITPLHRSSPGMGEIVAFIHPVARNLIVHRVLAKLGTAYLIQGDSVDDHSDGWVPPENILGQVMRIERNGHLVWLGLGLERFIIAWLSRVRLLIPIRVRLVSILKRFS